MAIGIVQKIGGGRAPTRFRVDNLGVFNTEFEAQRARAKALGLPAPEMPYGHPLGNIKTEFLPSGAPQPEQPFRGVPIRSAAIAGGEITGFQPGTVLRSEQSVLGRVNPKAKVVYAEKKKPRKKARTGVGTKAAPKALTSPASTASKTLGGQ